MRVEYLEEIEVAKNSSHKGMSRVYIKLNNKKYTIETYGDSTLPRGHQLCLELERILKDAFDSCGS